MALKLTIEDVDAGYRAVRALHGVSLEISQGETVALLGTNGNGKSTLMKCIMGIVRPTRGSVTLELDGQRHDLTQLSTEEIVNLGVAMVPEGRRLFPKLTVEENLLLGAFRPLARGDIARNLEYSYETFPALKERRRQLAGSMSGGQQQMLAIARALIGNPTLLLMDEPLEGLAPIIVDALLAVIARLIREEALTVVLVEQSARLALEVTERALVLSRGRIVHAGASAELLADPDRLASLVVAQ